VRKNKIKSLAEGILAMDGKSLTLTGLVLLMVLIGVTLTALVSGYSSQTIEDFPLYSLPFMSFVVALLIAAYVLAEDVIFAGKGFLLRLTMVSGAAFLLGVFFTLMIFLFQTFVMTKTLEGIVTGPEVMGPFINLLYLTGALLALEVLAVSLLSHHWKGESIPKYPLSVIVFVMVYALGAPPWEAVLGFAFLLILWASVFMAGADKPATKASKATKKTKARKVRKAKR
jgi:hypothetical protein